MGCFSISASGKASLPWKDLATILPVIRFLSLVCTVGFLCCMRKKVYSKTRYGSPSISKIVPLLKSVYDNMLKKLYIKFNGISSNNRFGNSCRASNENEDVL